MTGNTARSSCAVGSFSYEEVMTVKKKAKKKDKKEKK
jgi:hypothetical protein